jgi:LAS superfamily LD-carboxypeptidase LdcB
MHLSELFKSSKKLLLGGSNNGRGSTPNPFMSNGTNATGIGQNSATSSANSLTKGMDNAKGLTKGLDGVNGLVRTEIASGRGTKKIDNQAASGDNSIQKTPQQRVAEYEQKQKDLNNRDIPQNSKIKQDKFEDHNTKYDFNAQVAQQKNQSISKISYAGASSVVSKPDINSLTKQTTAIQVGSGNSISQNSFQVGSGNVNNDPSFGIGQNVKGLVSDQVTTQFAGQNYQNQAYGQRVIGVGQGLFDNVNPLVNGANQTQFIPGQIVQVGQSGQFNPNQNVIPVGSNSNSNPNDILNKGFLAETVLNPNNQPLGVGQTSQQPIGVGQYTQTIIGVGQNEASAVVQSSEKNLKDSELYERILKETRVTIEAHCKSVYEYYLVDLSFAFPADLISLIETKQIRVQIGKSCSVLIKKDLTGQYYALVDVGEFKPEISDNEHGGYRSIQLDLDLPENQQEFSLAQRVEIRVTDSEIVNTKQEEHNKRLKTNRQETKGTEENNAQLELYKKIADETKLRFDSKKKFKEGEDVELIFQFPKIDSNQRIPESLFVNVNGLPFKTQIQTDKEGKKLEDYRYFITLGKYVIIDDQDELELFLEFPATITDSGQKEYRIFKLFNIKLEKSEEKSQDLASLVESVGSVNINKGKQDLVKIGQSNTEAKGIGNDDVTYNWAANSPKIPTSSGLANVAVAGLGSGEKAQKQSSGRTFSSPNTSNTSSSENYPSNQPQNLEALRQYGRNNHSSKYDSKTGSNIPTDSFQGGNKLNSINTGTNTPVRMGGINGDIPLVDAQGRPLISGDNKFNGRTNVVGAGISGVFNSQTNTVIGVSQAGNLVSNSLGRADNTSTKSNDSAGTDNQGNQPPKPPKPPTGGSSSNDYNEQNNSNDDNTDGDETNTLFNKPDFDGIPNPWDDTNNDIVPTGYKSKPQQKLLSGRDLSILSLPPGQDLESGNEDEFFEDGEIDPEQLKNDLVKAADVLAAAKLVDPQKDKQDLINKINTRTALPQSVEARTNARDEDKALPPADTEPLGPNILEKFTDATKSAADAAIKNAIRGFLAANAPFIAGIVAICLLFLMILAAVIAIECDGGKTDKNTFDWLDGNVKLIEKGLKFSSGDVIGVVKDIADDAGKDLKGKATNTDGSKSKLNEWIVKNIPGCNTNICATSGAGVGKVDNATVSCFAKQIEGKSDNEKVTLFKAQGGVSQSKDMTVKTAKEILSFVGKDGITANVAAWVMSLATTESGGGKWDLVGGSQNQCYGIIQFCANAAGGFTYQNFTKAALGATPSLESFRTDKLAQMKTAAYAYGEKLKIGRSFPQLSNRSDIELASAFWLGNCAAKNKNATWEEMHGRECGGGVKGVDYANSALKNYAIITCSGSEIPGLKAGATKPAQLDKFAEPIRLAQIEESRTLVNQKLSKIIGVPVNYKSQEENNKNPEMNSYGIPELDRKINQFNEFMKGEVIVEAASASGQKVVDLLKSGAITTQDSTDSATFAAGKFDDKLAELLIYLVDKGFTFKGGPNNYRPEGRSGSQHATGKAYDFAEIGKKGGKSFNIKLYGIGGGAITEEMWTLMKEFTDAIKSSGLLNGRQLIGPDSAKKKGYILMNTTDAGGSYHEDHIHVGINSSGTLDPNGSPSVSSGSSSDPCCPDGGSSPTTSTTVSLDNFFDPIVSEAADATGNTDVAAARKKLVDLFNKGFIGQIESGDKISDKSGYEKDMDDNMILFLYDLYYKAGITWIGGFNNFSRGRDHSSPAVKSNGTAYDFWGFAKVSDFEGANKKLGNMDGKPSDFGSFVSGMGPTPSTEGNKSDPKIIRHIDNFSTNPQIAQLAFDITIKVAELALSSGVAKSANPDGSGFHQIFSTDKVAAELQKRHPKMTFQGHSISLGAGFADTPIGKANGHHNHIHISLFRASVKKYSGISGDFSQSSSPSSCCPSTSTTPEKLAAVTSSSSSEPTKKAELLDIFKPIEASAFGSPPASYSAIDAEHKKLLAEAAAKIKAPAYEDAGKLNPEAAAAFAKLKIDAAKKGFSLKSLSDYRGYNGQVETFFKNGGSGDKITNFYKPNMTAIERAKVLAGYVKRGESSFPPGFSEHHTGLAFDIIGSDGKSGDIDRATYPTDLANYLAENAPKFGFSLSFDKNSGGANGGAKYEPWHWYFGKSKSKSGETAPTNTGSGYASCCPTTTPSPTEPTASPPADTAKNVNINNLFDPITTFAETAAQILATKVDTVANQGLTGEEKAFLDMIAVKESGKYTNRDGAGSAKNVGKYQIGAIDVPDAINALKAAAYDIGNLSEANALEPANQDLVAIGRILRNVQLKPTKSNQKLSQILTASGGFNIALGNASREFQALPDVPGFPRTFKGVNNGFTISVATSYYKQQLTKYGAGGGNGLTGSTSIATSGSCEPSPTPTTSTAQLLYFEKQRINV